MPSVAILAAIALQTRCAMLGTKPDGFKRIRPCRIAILAVARTVTPRRLTTFAHALASPPLTSVEVVQTPKLRLELGNLLLLRRTLATGHGRP